MLCSIIVESSIDILYSITYNYWTISDNCFTVQYLLARSWRAGAALVTWSEDKDLGQSLWTNNRVIIYRLQWWHSNFAKVRWCIFSNFVNLFNLYRCHIISKSNRLQWWHSNLLKLSYFSLSYFSLILTHVSTSITHVAEYSLTKHQLHYSSTRFHLFYYNLHRILRYNCLLSCTFTYV